MLATSTEGRYPCTESHRLIWHAKEKESKESAASGTGLRAQEVEQGWVQLNLLESNPWSVSICHEHVLCFSALASSGCVEETWLDGQKCIRGKIGESTRSRQGISESFRSLRDWWDVFRCIHFIWFEFALFPCWAESPLTDSKIKLWNALNVLWSWSGACLYAGSVSFMAGLKEQAWLRDERPFDPFGHLSEVVLSDSYIPAHTEHRRANCSAACVVHFCAMCQQVVQMSCFSKYNISGTGLLDQAQLSTCFVDCRHLLTFPAHVIYYTFCRLLMASVD